jgi:hypothetical protein
VLVFGTSRAVLFSQPVPTRFWTDQDNSRTLRGRSDSCHTQERDLHAVANSHSVWLNEAPDKELDNVTRLLEVLVIFQHLAVLDAKTPKPYASL